MFGPRSKDQPAQAAPSAPSNVIAPRPIRAPLRFLRARGKPAALRAPPRGLKAASGLLESPIRDGSRWGELLGPLSVRCRPLGCGWSAVGAVAGEVGEFIDPH